MNKPILVSLFEHCEQKRKNIYDAAIAAGKAVDVAELEAHIVARDEWNRWVHCLDSTLDFEKHKFYNANFSEFIFPNDVNFKNTKFYGRTNFYKSEFREYVTFEKAYFGGRVLFNEARFVKSVIFQETHFNSNAYFIYTEFCLSVWFRRATFQEDTFFSEAKFLITDTRGSSRWFRQGLLSHDIWFEGV
jgi:hypothetical protein